MGSGHGQPKRMDMCASSRRATETGLSKAVGTLILQRALDVGCGDLEFIIYSAGFWSSIDDSFQFSYFSLLE